MSFERLRRVPRTVGFRLAVWSSAFFVASTLVSFGLAYVLVSSSLQQSERASIQMELDELAARYRSGGLPGLAQELALLRPRPGRARERPRRADAGLVTRSAHQG